MESNGQALKIHLSPITKSLLDKFQTFIVTPRGQVNLKVIFVQIDQNGIILFRFLNLG